MIQYMLLGSRRFSSRKRIINKKKEVEIISTNKYSITGSKGVRASKKQHRIIYLTSQMGGRGVRNDNVIYSIPEQTTTHTLQDMLHYSRPCICGSLLHSKRTHVNCLLNPRYDDA